MMTTLLFKHPKRVAKAVTTNLLAVIAPGWYSRWTRETGRGLTPMSAEETAAYFILCVDDYRQRLKLDQAAWSEFLRDKRILEYGPGDIPGVALLLIGLGAREVICADRFPLVTMSTYNREVMRRLVESLDGARQSRAEAASMAFIDSNGTSGPIRYQISPDGTSGRCGDIDLVISRAVLEHVADLDAIFADMRRALSQPGLAIHQVDLKSHGMHMSNSLDFLIWPDWLWRLMYSHKGAPNRVRPPIYRKLAEQNGFNIIDFTTTGQADESDWAGIKAQLGSEYASMPKEDICCTGFWMTLTSRS